jgi:hypothetical protein
MYTDVEDPEVHERRQDHQVRSQLAPLPVAAGDTSHQRTAIEISRR